MSITLPQINLSTSPMPVILNTLPSNLQLHQVSWIRFLNESPYTLTVNMGGINIPIPAWTDYPVQISVANRVLSGASLPLNINWTLLSNINNVSTVLILTFYSPGETPSSTTPVDLTRQVASDVANATSVTNTGFPIGTPFISGSVVGDVPGTANVTITNDGHETLGSQNYPGRLDLLNVSGTGDLFLTGIGEVTWTFGGIQEFALQGSQEATLGQPILSLRDTNNNAIILSPFLQTVSGTTGTITCIQYFYGGFRATFVRFSNYTNGSIATIALPNAFVGRSLVRTGTIGTGGVVSFMKVGVAQNISIVTALAAAGGTVAALQTTINQHSFGEIQSGWDTLQVAAIVASTSGVMEIRGV